MAMDESEKVLEEYKSIRGELTDRRLNMDVVFLKVLLPVGVFSVFIATLITYIVPGMAAFISYSPYGFNPHWLFVLFAVVLTWTIAVSTIIALLWIIIGIRRRDKKETQ